MTREQAEARAREAGARTASSVTRDVSLVIAGVDRGTKYATARARGIPIIDERQFARLSLAQGDGRRGRIGVAKPVMTTGTRHR
jgi:NAD-dependent DNA ligase